MSLFKRMNVIVGIGSAVLAVFLIGAATARAEAPRAIDAPMVGGLSTLYVATNGNNANACTGPGVPCLTIAGAIGKASAGSTIIIATGKYTENLTATVALTFIGAGADATIIDGGGVGRVLTMTSGSIYSLTVRNGAVVGGSNNGGGINASGALTLTSVNVVSNTTAQMGGGLFVNGAATITGSQFMSNTADTGGGLFVNGAATIAGSQFISNTAGSQGGGLYASGAATIAGSQFMSNTAGGNGGGLSAGDVATIAGTQFMNNTAGSQGGGLYASGAATIAGSQFISNTAGTTGGGLYVNNAAAITGTQFMSNTAGSQGGGLYVSRGGATITGTQLIRNSAGRGGGLYFNGYNFGVVGLRLTNVLLAANSAITDGAALYLYSTASQGGVATIVHTTIASPTVGTAQAIFVGKPDAYAVGLNLTNTIVASYTTGLSLMSGAVITADYNLFFNAPTTAPIGAHSITGADPLFRNAAGHDYQLTSGSPAIDAGVDASVTTDLNGNARPIGFGFDIGAYEANVAYITSTAGLHGSIVPSSTYAVVVGTDQLFTIVANTGYHLLDVGVDGASQGALSVYTFTNVTANHTITATFAINTFLITPTAGANGAITPNTAQTVNYSATQVFAIAANTGYHIADVGVDGASVGVMSAYTFTNVTANHTISATFASNVLYGRVALEKRGAAGTSRWVTPLYRVGATGGVQLYQAGTSNLVAVLSATTDVNGLFTTTIEGVASGLYDVVVKGANTLSNKKFNVSIPPVSVIDFGTLLVGDSNGDDGVNGADVSYMVPSFIRCAGDAPYRPYGDTNADGCINGADVSALIHNYLLAGPITMTASSYGPLSDSAVVIAETSSIELSRLPQGLQAGDVFTTSVLVNTGMTSFDTVDAYLDFDPTQLEVVDTTGALAQTVTLNTNVYGSATLNAVNNAAGTINLSMSRYVAPWLYGSYSVATIQLRARVATAAPSVQLVRNGSRRSDLYLAGESLQANLGSTFAQYLPIIAR